VIKFNPNIFGNRESCNFSSQFTICCHNENLLTNPVGPKILWKSQTRLALVPA
jgi:hypothetical protein